MGCDLKFLIDEKGPIDISIHAPVWGATLKDFKQIEVKNISIHAPVWGATQKWNFENIPT